MAQFIDRRLNGKNKSAVNRQRFLRRHKQKIKESVTDAVNRRSITNTETGEDVSIPSKDLNELSSIKAKGASKSASTLVTISSSLATKSNAHQKVAAAVALGKVKLALMERVKTNLCSRYPKMNTWIFCSKISRFQI